MVTAGAETNGENRGIGNYKLVTAVIPVASNISFCYNPILAKNRQEKIFLANVNVCQLENK